MLQNSQKVPVSESLFNNVSGWGPWNFIKKEILAQVFSCEFCEIFKSTFFTEHILLKLLSKCRDVFWMHLAVNSVGRNVSL